MTSGQPRITPQTQAVLRVFLSDPFSDRYGLDLMSATGLASGTLYPLLARLEKAGWVERRWEDDAACEAEGRPRRRYYRLTSDGLADSRQALAEIRLAQQGNAPARPFGCADPSGA